MLIGIGRRWQTTEIQDGGQGQPKQGRRYRRAWGALVPRRVGEACPPSRRGMLPSGNIEYYNMNIGIYWEYFGIIWFGERRGMIVGEIRSVSSGKMPEIANER